MAVTKIKGGQLDSVEFIEFIAGSNPSTPSAGFVRVYNAGGTSFKKKDSSGTALDLVVPEFNINYTFGNGGAVLSTGIAGAIHIPFNYTIQQWTLGSLDGTTGSIVIDIWKDTYANFPPTVADSITASAKPTISSAVKGQSSTLTGWTTTISGGDSWLFFNIDSVTSLKLVSLNLKCVKY